MGTAKEMRRNGARREGRRRADGCAKLDGQSVIFASARGQVRSWSQRPCPLLPPAPRPWLSRDASLLRLVNSPAGVLHANLHRCLAVTSPLSSTLSVPSPVLLLPAAASIAARQLFAAARFRHLRLTLLCRTDDSALERIPTEAIRSSGTLVRLNCRPLLD
ncbi:hypothetical protein BU26DRAFT_183662 [Trematosphaeria pertusa]|uniref:Uncharacterized protein n=1 Tax=Trematosphaeria pertusa TaxID=390896 RepID=A0A6A6HT08_9PLEO|nr:uncharacterized protein BU26DRAFT_183662 [Trematosphaeria pertusa]KAF2241236.1 hypothetical protein BU26DRAFT_183662 [Trematosphaeria pertusa]